MAGTVSVISLSSVSFALRTFTRFYSLPITDCMSSSFRDRSSSYYYIIIALSSFITISVSRFSHHSRSWTGVPYREVSRSSSSLLSVVSLYSRLWISSCSASSERGLGEEGVPADNDSCLPKANSKSCSSSVMFSLFYPLSLILEGLESDWGGPSSGTGSSI